MQRKLCYTNILRAKVSGGPAFVMMPQRVLSDRAEPRALAAGGKVFWACLQGWQGPNGGAGTPPDAGEPRIMRAACKSQPNQK